MKSLRIGKTAKAKSRAILSASRKSEKVKIQGDAEAASKWISELDAGGLGISKRSRQSRAQRASNAPPFALRCCEPELGDLLGDLGGASGEFRVHLYHFAPCQPWLGLAKNCIFSGT